MANGQGANEPDFLVALQDFRALVQVGSYLAGVARAAALSRGRQKVARLYFHYIGSVTEALALLTEAYPSQPMTNAGFPRVPHLAPLTRQLLETHAWFRFYAVDPVSDEEASFRYLVADIQAGTDDLRLGQMHYRQRSTFEPASWERGPEARGFTQALGKKQRHVRGLRQELCANSFFQRLCAECQTYWAHTGKGFWPASSAVLARAGLGAHLLGTEYDYLSAHSHASPSAVKAAVGLRPAGPAEHMGLFHLWAGLLALAVEELLGLLPSCSAALTDDERQNVHACAAYYVQFVYGRIQSAAASAFGPDTGCPTCWLRRDSRKRGA